LFATIDAQGVKGRPYAAAGSEARPSYGVKSPKQAAESQPREAALPAFVEPPAAPNPEPPGNDEPGMPYSFSYTAEATDGLSARQETSDGNVVRGSYMLEGPDGINRVVHYIADKDGFRATITTNEPGTESQSPSGVLFTSSQLPASEIALQYGPGEPSRTLESDRRDEQPAPRPVAAVLSERREPLRPLRREQPLLAPLPLRQREPLPLAPLPLALALAPLPLAPLPLAPRPLAPRQQAPILREAALGAQFNALPRAPTSFGFRSDIRHDAQPSQLQRAQAVKGAAPTEQRSLLQAPVKSRPQAPQIIQNFRAPAKAPLPPPPPAPRPLLVLQPSKAIVRQPALPILRTSGKQTLVRNPRPFFAPLITTTTEEPRLVFDEQQQQQEEQQQEEAEPAQQQQQEEEPEPVSQQQQQQELLLDEPQQRGFFGRRRARA